MKLSGPRSASSTALALSLSGLLLSVPPLAAQAPPADGGETFFESIDVEVVNVEVFVTRRDGEPVRGLNRDDFQLFEDGKPVAITNFYAVAEGVQQGRAEEAAPAPAAGAAVPAAATPKAATVPEEQRLDLALYVDDRNLTAAGRNRVLAEVEKFFAGRPKGEDRLLLVRYNGSLEVRHAPTDDPAALAAALDEVARSAPRGSHDLAETRHLLSQIERGLDDEDQLLHSIQSYTQARQREIESSFEALGECVGWLAALPGRKALLYVSGGLSLEPGEALRRVWEAKYGDPGTGYLEAQEHATERLLARVVARANANRVTFYALGAPEAVGGSSAEFAGTPYWTREGLEAVEQTNRTDSLLGLSAGTGGLAALDAVRAQSVLERMRRDLDSYYSLGFTPTDPRDGRTHRLKVKVRDRSLQVRHREAYRSRSMAEVIDNRVLAALALGEASNPLAVTLELGKEERTAQGEVQVPVLVRFALSDLALVPRDAFHEGRVRLYVAASDDQGRSSPVREIEVPVRVPKERLREALGRPAGYVFKLQLRPGRNRVAVTVLDEVSKVSSTVATSYPP